MSITVAIVEDDAGIRDALIRILGRSRDFHCLGCYPSAEDALRELPTVKPDVVLMDINLPGMNGVECVRKLKAQAFSAHVGGGAFDGVRLALGADGVPGLQVAPQ